MPKIKIKRAIDIRQIIYFVKNSIYKYLPMHTFEGIIINVVNERNIIVLLDFLQALPRFPEINNHGNDYRFNTD